jgi:hypothetical protein
MQDNTVTPLRADDGGSTTADRNLSEEHCVGVTTGDDGSSGLTAQERGGES